MRETSEATPPDAATVTVSMPHGCIVVKSSATEGGGGNRYLSHGITAVKPTLVFSLCAPFKTFKGNVDSLRVLMPRRLD